MVVGASSNPDKLGYAMAASLGAFPREVQLVNSRPSAGIFGSVTDAVDSARSPVDLAVMCVPASITATALRESFVMVFDRSLTAAHCSRTMHGKYTVNAR